MRPSEITLRVRLYCGLFIGGLMVMGVLAVLLPARPAPVMAEESPVTQTAAGTVPAPLPVDLHEVDLSKQTKEEKAAKSQGCVHCHQDTHDPHQTDTINLGCVDCHGGDPTSLVKEVAHVTPRFPNAWVTSANPVRSYTLLNHESPEFVRFVNPGDLRVAKQSCGTTGCHAEQVLQVQKSMMTHGCMLWGAAAYNNGALPVKWSIVGESYSTNGVPQILMNVPAPTPEETATKGVVPFLVPLPRFEVTQPGNIFRIFERGGRFNKPEVGIPNPNEEPGRPRTRLSNRGLGTLNRTDPTIVAANKTRLLDPTLNFLGTNDHPGDYRSSGCTACHVIYANDRWEVNSGPYAKYGNQGLSFSKDPTIPKEEKGHPIDHKFTNAIPTSQCMVCHIHPGTNVLNSYSGFMWWDMESDAELMYPEHPKKPTAEQIDQASFSDPHQAAAKGLWSDPEFLENVWMLNEVARKTQFADFHGHGWLFNAVFRKDRQGNYLDWKGDIVEPITNEKLQAALVPPTPEEILHGKKRDGIPVHYMDIHLEKGMHCVDCHFMQDNHGNMKLYGEVRAAIEIQCIDCHGTVDKEATLITSGPAAGKGTDLSTLRVPHKPAEGETNRRFEWIDGKLYQRSMVNPGQKWEVVQTKDTVNPDSPHYNQKAALAKTVRFDDDGNFVWGDLPAGGADQCAHVNKNMSCIACHSAWNPSCFGCHLPQKADSKTPMLHWAGDVTKNYVPYNWQTLRDDVYMLAKDGTVTGNRIGPARSSCAIHVGSYNDNRESIYVQQQTVSAEGFSGIAFSTNVPHTVRGKDGTKQCTDCHLSNKDDNNAIMAQLLMHGTNYVNFIGKYCWVANGEHGLHGVVVTEREEPQTVIGSTLHKIVYPEEFKKHCENGYKLEHAHEHPGKDIADNIFRPFKKPEILQVQNRGEYLYAACGHGGLRIFDIAFIDHKGFAERITTAPVSPVGQRFYVKTSYCTAVAAPSTMILDAARQQNPANQEQKIHQMYRYIYAVDKYEGMIVVCADTLFDGDPYNNFLERSVTFNPEGVLNGSKAITIVGTYAYICSDAGLVVVSLEDPLHPYVTSVLGHDTLHHPHAVQVQFRYGFVCDEHGIKVLDVTDLAHPKLVSELELHDAHNIYLARTYAYVAGGHQGLIILDITNPEKPVIDQIYDANGCMNDVHDVKLGITYTSEFAYVADGKNGLRILQLTSPETPGYQGFSPRPVPQLIATYEFPHGGHALYVAEGLDRDRAVDESGNQLGVFGRVGARPLTLPEQQKLYMRNGQIWKTSDDPQDPIYGKPRPFKP